jgi:hypothetical protein
MCTTCHSYYKHNNKNKAINYTYLTWMQSCNQLDDKGRGPSELRRLVDFVFDCYSK